MTLDTLATVFGWMTLINLGIYIASALLVFALRDWISNFQGQLFEINPAAIRQIIYGWLGAYKLLIIVFCAVPYVALRIVG